MKHYCAHGIAPAEANTLGVPGRFIGTEDITPRWCPHMDKVREGD
jgi:hypothetical protein